MSDVTFHLAVHRTGGGVCLSVSLCVGVDVDVGMCECMCQSVYAAAYSKGHFVHQE